MPPDPLPVMTFESTDAWDAWLAAHHDGSPGLWLKIAKKGAAGRTISYSEALDVALCHGWIDSQKRPKDARSWLQRFGPRRARGGWSRINTRHAERLIEAGRMKRAGLREVEAAKADGRWQRAYDSPGAVAVPADFLEQLSRNKKAKAFFEGLNKANTYAIAYRLQTARKPETREKRMRSILAMMAKGEKIHT
jgi:uncharacterized protein YdeI (YjbR/CyaY-like superfamily)